ncbi:hypothetical protein pb186bvf_008465 [Paramecium bursaria]
MEFVQQGKIQDIDSFLNQIVKLAYETEQIKLDPQLVRQASDYLIQNEHFGLYLLYRSDQITKGSIMLTKEYNIYNGYVQWVQSVYVEKEYRCQNIFRCLFMQFLSLAKENEAKKCKLYVYKENQLAQKVYQKVGMKQNDEIIYEDDFFFNQSAGLKLKENIKISAINNSEELQKYLSSGHKSLSYNIHEEELAKIDMYIGYLKNPYIMASKDQYNLIALYFTEFSDWRFGITIWFYDFISNTDDPKIIEDLLHQILASIRLNSLNFNPIPRCTRIIINKDNGFLINILQNIIPESHYFVYEIVL